MFWLVRKMCDLSWEKAKVRERHMRVRFAQEVQALGIGLVVGGMRALRGMLI